MSVSQLCSLLGLGMPLLLLITGLSLYLLYKFLTPRRRPLPPGPTTIDLFFDVLKAVKNETLHLLAEKLARQYGEVVLCKTIIGNLCFLNSGRVVREIFAGKGTELVTSDRPPVFTGLHVFYKFQDVAFSDTSKNPNWFKMRKLLHSTLKFYGSGVEKFESTLQTELHRITRALETEIPVSTGGFCEVELEKFFSTSIQRVLAIMVTGEPQKPDSKLPPLIGNYSVSIQKLSSPSSDFLLHTFPFLRFVPGTYYKDLCAKALMHRDNLMEEVFTKGKAKHVPGEPKGMLGTILEAQINGGCDWLTDDNIRGLLLNMFMGAFITSTELLKASFLYLVHNPHVMTRIQREVDSVFGQRTPTLEDRRNLPFTEATVLEVLRSSSSVPLGVAHEATEDIVFDGFCIPKGTVLFENMWWMHQDPNQWEDSDVFRPERFLDDAGELLPPNHPTRLKFLPFGIGKRSCPGENFARSRAFLYLTTLLQKFDFLPPVNHNLLPLKLDSWTGGIVLQLKPCHVAIKRRSQ